MRKVTPLQNLYGHYIGFPIGFVSSLESIIYMINDNIIFEKLLFISLF